jgi:predicted metallopeptidase
MVIRYFRAPDLEVTVSEIVGCVGLTHVDLSRVVVLRSRGSRASRTLARIHGLPRIWQLALGLKPRYIIEVISEQFDRLSQEEKEKTLIHELLHIPKGFGGGFKHHGNWVDRRRVERMYHIFRAQHLPSSGH